MPYIDAGEVCKKAVVNRMRTVIVTISLESVGLVYIHAIRTNAIHAMHCSASRPSLIGKSATCVSTIPCVAVRAPIQ